MIFNKQGIVIFKSLDPGQSFRKELERAIQLKADLHGADLEMDNLERMDFSGSAMCGASFKYSKLEGANFELSDLEASDFTSANLRNANFSKANLYNADLTLADVRGCNFRGADLTDVTLSFSIFDQSAISTLGFIVPVVPFLDQKILERIEMGGTINMANWHSCETEHCIAGWTIHVAGGDGYALEKMAGTNLAAAMIYSRSTGHIPSFSGDNDLAMHSLVRRASGT